MLAREVLDEIEKWRRQAPPPLHQLDWRWIERSRELDAFDASWWWAQAAPFSNEQRRPCDQLSPLNLHDATKQQLGQGQNVLYAIDIDGTIANPEAVLIAFHNQEFALGLTSEQLRCPYSQFLHLPQVAALPREALHDSRHRARTTAQTVLAYDEIEHAVLAVNFLATQGEIRYYTVRPACVQEATHTWLQKKQFPHPQNLTLCHSVLHKLVQLFVQERETHHWIVLIDDRYQHMMEDFARLAHGELSHLSDWQEVVQFAQQRVLLVAFGATCVSADTTGLQVVPMPSWNHLAERSQLSFVQ